MSNILMKNRNKSVKKGGFTVLESIVAIFVLSLAISGGFSSVRQGLSQANIAKDEVKAFYLAQEAVEIIRNKRDSNQLLSFSNPSITWLSGITATETDPCYFGKVCRVDTNPYPPTLTYCNSTSWDSCPNLVQSNTTFLYNYSSGNNTPFKREVKIESINSEEIAVIVRIKWTTKGSSREFLVKTHLFNRI
jgi:type II secretory pathway pseudopilin PulG